MLLAVGASAATVAVLVLVVASPVQPPVGRAELLAAGGSQLAGVNQRIRLDEQRLGRDIEQRNRLMQSLVKYPDGCVCKRSNCLTPNCDEENGDGPLCKCPKEGKQSMPDAATPWPLARRAAPRMGGSALREVHPPRAAAEGPYDRAVMPPYAGAHARAPGGARTQQKWVGSPQKFLPTDGDYPGGSTGIPEDGYVAFETGHANDGPYHGLIAPMQEAGIMAEPTSARQVGGEQQLRMRMQRPPSLASGGSDADERVPARIISPGYFTGLGEAHGPTVRAAQSLF